MRRRKINYNWHVLSQDNEALADRSYIHVPLLIRPLICDLCDSLAYLMIVIPSNNKHSLSDCQIAI